MCLYLLTFCITRFYTTGLWHEDAFDTSLTFSSPLFKKNLFHRLLSPPSVWALRMISDDCASIDLLIRKNDIDFLMAKPWIAVMSPLQNQHQTKCLCQNLLALEKAGEWERLVSQFNRSLTYLQLVPRRDVSQSLNFCWVPKTADTNWFYYKLGWRK